MRATYHHGDLRQTLLGAGVALARDGGPDAVVLREAARQAGVSHTAAYRHFADREELLAGVSAYAAGALAHAMEDRLKHARKPRRRLRAVGEAYIDFALQEPGLFRTAFGGSHEHSVSTGAPTDNGRDPFSILAQTLDELQATGELPARHRPGAEFAAWSAVHGLATLIISGPLSGLTDTQRHHATTVVLDNIEAGLLDAPEGRRKQGLAPPATKASSSPQRYPPVACTLAANGTADPEVSDEVPHASGSTKPEQP